MELNYLRTVLAVIELGSNRKAAEMLNLAPATVSVHVHQVEQDLGTTLLAKSGRGLRPTESALALVPRMRELLAQADQLRQPVAATTFTLAVPETLLTHPLQPVLAAFKRQCPTVQLQLRVLNCYDIYAQLMAGQVDCAVQYAVRPYPDSIHTLTLATYPVGLYAAATLACTDFITPDRTLPVALLHDDLRARYLEPFTHYLSERHLHLAPALDLYSLQAIVNSAASGLGVAFLPQFCVQEALDAKRLVSIPTGLDHPTVTAIAAYRPEPTSATQAFVALLSKWATKESE